MVAETYSEAELGQAFDEYRVAYGERSPMKTDNTLSRQGFVNALVVREKAYWAAEVEQGAPAVEAAELIKEVRAQAEKFKAAIRAVLPTTVAAVESEVAVDEVQLAD
jgi:hypothetical protein